MAAATALADVSTGKDASVPKGAFVRKESIFRHEIKKGGQYPPATGRYLLYVSYACPWASRCLALRSMKGLQDVIDLAIVAADWIKTKEDPEDHHRGWYFEPTYPGATADPVFGAKTIREVYEKATENFGPEFEKPSRFTVPILFDKETKTIVNNESSEIIRFLNTEFNEFAKYPNADTYPEKFRVEIDAVNESVYESVNNGVYKCGFAQSQEAYNVASGPLFKRLQELDDLLGQQRYLVKGAGLTEADLRLFVTVVRYDPVYFVHFKCAKKLIREYKNLGSWMRDVYQTAQLADTVNMAHIRDHYFICHKSINPYSIVPITENDLDSPHGRESVSL